MKTLRVLSLMAIAACNGSHPSTGSTEQAVWSNGDFESDSIGAMPPTGWTLNAYLNPGITDTRPGVQTLASLNLAGGGTQMTYVVGGTAESQADPDVGTGGTLRFPKYGTRAAVINYGGMFGGGTGTGRNTNALTQQMTVGLGDVDPTDNKVHVRFAVAPVLENPSHSYDSQPYYFVRLQNLTRGTTLYSDFNASGQPGVPWKNFTDTSGQAAQYTDWQLVDISPGNASLAVGDQVELMVIAAGCSAGGHWGRVYVDAVGSGIPGLYTWATGVQQVNSGSDITYTVNYKNGGTTTTSGTTLALVTPPSTTYKSYAGASCTAPSVGATGTVSCSLGTLAPGATGSFTITVNVDSGTANGTLITNGNYAIAATGVSALVGPKVYSTVTSGVQYADLAITATDGVAALGWGQPTTYTIVVSNAGPYATTATVTDTMPAELSGATWTCSAAGGGTCSASGNGDISDAVSLPVGATLTYTVSGTSISGTGIGSMVHTASVAATGGITDPDSTNNAAVDTDTLGTLSTLTVTKAGNTSAGSVASTPAAISCGTACSSASADFLDSSQVVLTAAPITGASFVGWGGACSGTSTTCTVTMSGATNVTATFAGAPSATVVSSGSPQSTTTSTAFSAPLAVLVTDNGGSPVAGATVTFAAPGSGATASLSATTAVTNASGIAQVTATANAIGGSYSVTGSISGITPVATFSLTNIGVPASIAVSAGGTQSATVNTAFGASLVAVVRDAGNYPVPGVTVTFSAPGSGASASLWSTTAITDISGLATITATAGTVAGNYSVTATVSGVASPASFSLTNLAGAATAISKVSGDAQSATVATAFAPLVVRATDTYGNSVAGVSVTFAPPGSGATASLGSASTTTNASGLAQTTATASTVTGAYSVSATAPSLSALSFSLTNTAGAPATMTVAGGDSQSTIVHTAFAQPLSVTVRDAYGNLVPGATVTFTGAPSGAATATFTAATTNASGVASSTATANDVAGSYTSTAAIASGPSTTFAMTNLPDVPASLAITAGSSQSATVATAFGTPIAVRVLDQYGNPVPSTSVSLAGPGSGASIASPATLVTGLAGTASTTVTANHTAGSYVVTASVSGVAATPTASLTNLPGVATTLAVVSGSGQHAVVAATFSAPLVVVATDTYGNTVPNTSVTFTAPHASFSPASLSTNGSGQASSTATAGTTATAYTVTATIPNAQTTFSLTNDHGPPAAIAIASGNPQTTMVDTAFGAPLVVHVTDVYGNDVHAARVSFVAPGSGPRATLSVSSVMTDNAGTAQTLATAGQVAGVYGVSATVSGLPSATFSLTNTPDAVASLRATGGGAQSATVLDAFAQPLAVHATDRFDNAVAGVTVTFTAPASGASATFATATATTDSHGDAQISATAGATAGTYDVTASSVGATDATFALTNVAGEAVALVAEGGAPQSATVATAFAAPLRVSARDAHGNTVAGVVVHFASALSPASATLSASIATTGADGIASVDATANTIAGAHDVTASLGGSGLASFHLTNTADVAASIAADPTASPQQMTVLMPYAMPLTVVVRDQYGNTVPGAVVTYAAPSSGASAALSAATATTGADGTASVDATATATAGAFVVQATVAGVETPAAFVLLNMAGAPATLVVAGGDGQSAEVTTLFAQSLSARVLDADGNPVPGVTVSFTAAPGAATALLGATSVLSDADGLASVTARATTAAGSYTVTASLAGATSPVSFALANTPGAPASITPSDTSTPQNAQVDTAFLRPLVATVRDQYGNPVPGVTVTYTMPATGATCQMSAVTAVTGPDGRVGPAADATSVAGAYTVTASVAGVSTPAAFQLANLPGEAYLVIAQSGADQSATVAIAFAQPVVARVEDTHGNAVPGVVVTFAAPATGASASFEHATVTTGADGTAATALTAGTHAGSFAVTATTPSGAAPATFALHSTAGAAATATAAASASPQSAEVGHAFAHPLALQLTDAYGNAVAGAQVTFSTPSAPGAQLSATTATTDANGSASILAIADASSGTYAVHAAVAGTSGTSFALTNTPAAPNAVAMTSGGAQRAMATMPYDEAITIRVTDSFGNPIPGATVTFSVPATGASGTLSAESAVTDATGDASVTVTAGAVVGHFEVSAHVAGTFGDARTTLEVLAIPTTIQATAADTTADVGSTVTVQVDAPIGTPSGTVDLVGDDGQRLATGTLVDGSATVQLPALAIGTHTVLARYAAQGSYAASETQAVTFEITDDGGDLSGGGCSTGGGSSSGWLVVLALGVLVARKRRWVAAACATAALAPAAVAEPEGSRSIDRFHAASPESAWFSLDSASFAGERAVTLAFVGDYANQPLTTYDADGNVRDRVVTDAFLVHVGASVVLQDRYRLSATVPMAPWQQGDGGTFNGMPLSSPTFAFGDVTIAGDVRAVGEPGAPLRLVVGARLAFPTGSRTNFMSDGTLAFEPRAALAGTSGMFEYAAGASAFLRSESTMAGATFGPELRYQAGVGVRLLDGRLFAGPELVGAAPLTSGSDVGTPLELQFGTHYSVTANVRLGLAASGGLINAVGEPSWRTVASLVWAP